MIISAPNNQTVNSPRRKFCFTVDVDWIPGSESGLESLLDYCAGRGFPLTLFVTGRCAGLVKTVLRGFNQVVEIGSHGWEHGLNPEENFRSSPREEQKSLLEKSTRAITETLGIRPRCFRAPFLSVDESTLLALEELGYALDSSVPSRRFDFGRGNVNYTRYFRAPLSPYHPSGQHLARRGTSPVLEVPPSACIAPLNMKALYKMGLGPFKLLVNGLSALTPVLVFYAHAYEFVRSDRLSFPASKRHWFEWSSPDHLRLLNSFVDYVLSLHYVPSGIAGLAEARNPAGKKPGEPSPARL